LPSKRDGPENLKIIRKKLKLSQAELAKLAGVRRVLIMSHEKGYRTLTDAEWKKITRAAIKEADRMMRELKQLPLERKGVLMR
jgi:predicted transcriptional regulator